ncbi:MAG: Flp family type IVb pilin [Sphingobium sp.]
MSNRSGIAPLGHRRSVFKCQRGATAMEYGLILALIALAVLSSMTFVATETINMWGNISNAVVNAG